MAVKPKQLTADAIANLRCFLVDEGVSEDVCDYDDAEGYGSTQVLCLELNSGKVLMVVHKDYAEHYGDLIAKVTSGDSDDEDEDD